MAPAELRRDLEPLLEGMECVLIGVLRADRESDLPDMLYLSRAVFAVGGPEYLDGRRGVLSTGWARMFIAPEIRKFRLFNGDAPCYCRRP